MISVTFDTKDFKLSTMKAKKKVKIATTRAVVRVTNETSRRAGELVPFDTGNLARSKVVTLPTLASKNAEGRIAFGGTAAPYAAVQHENLELWHPPKPPGKSKVGGNQGTGPVAPGTGRGPKFLEYPMKALSKVIDRVIAKEMKKELIR